MSGAKDDGWYAYPTTDEQSDNGISAAPGMTLRDYFAAKSLPLMVAIYDADSDNPFPILAKAVYAMADEMLKARKS